MSYLRNLITDILEIIISKLNYESFVNLSSSNEINMYNLNYNNIAKNRYPQLIQKEILNIISYINILVKYNIINKSSSIIDYTKYNYIVFNTGYTNRLINRMQELKESIINVCVDEGICDDLGDYDDDYLEKENIAKIIFIKDYDFYSKYNEETKYINDNLSEEEKNILPSIEEIFNVYGGMICFKLIKLNLYMIENVLKEMDYCALLDRPFKIGCFITFSGLKILYLEYDTESG